MSDWLNGYRGGLGTACESVPSNSVIQTCEAIRIFLSHVSVPCIQVCIVKQDMHYHMGKHKGHTCMPVPGLSSGIHHVLSRPHLYHRLIEHSFLDNVSVAYDDCRVGLRTAGESMIQVRVPETA